MPVSCSLTFNLGIYEITIPEDNFKEIRINKSVYLDPTHMCISEFFRENDALKLEKLYDRFLNDIRLIADELTKILDGDIVYTTNEFTKQRNLVKEKKETLLALAIANDYNISMEDTLKRIKELRKRG